MTSECSSRTRVGWRGAGFLAVLLLSSLSGCGSIPPEEEDEARRSLATERCEVEAPFTPGFEPELAWEKAGGAESGPFAFNQVRMTPVVVDVNADGTPDVVFIASRGIGSLGDGSTHDDSFPVGTFTGVLRAYSGDDGRELWSVTDTAYRVRGTANLAAGDLDGDGLVELCTLPANGLGLICFENTGEFKFRTASLEGQAQAFNDWGGPAMADLEGDGTVELLDANQVFDSTGQRKWVGSDLPGPTKGALSFAVDLDQDGTLEVVNGRSVYRHDGTLKCANKDIGQGLAAVANFDADPEGELAVTWEDKLTVLDDDCTEKWTRSVPGGLLPGTGIARAGLPSIADFDNDGQPELAVASLYQLTVFDTDGSILWTSPFYSTRIRMSGATAFDFEGDGRTELIYADGDYLRIYDGATGEVRFMTRHSSSRTFENGYEVGVPYETPVIADVDADGRADLVLASSNFNHEQLGFAGIRVFHDRNRGWRSARRIWNQHAYSVTNINDDGTLPAHPLAHWLTPNLNTFRVNQPMELQGVPAADLQVATVSATCTGGGPIINLAPAGLLLSARVLNGGDAQAPAGVKVAFYQGNPAAGGTLLGVSEVAGAIPPRSDVRVELTLRPAPSGLTEVWAVVDDDGTGAGTVTECREGNNGASTPLVPTCVGETNQPPVCLAWNVTVPADATCQASASVDAGSHDPDNQPGPLTLTQSPAGPFGLGRHAVTLAVSDGEASATCQATVEVVDVTAPTLTCPDPEPVVHECKGGHGGTPVSYAVDTGDNCGPVSTTCTTPSGGSFPVGTTPVTCTARDGSGNEASCGFSVTVRDTTAPTPGADKRLALWPPNHHYVTVKLSDCAQEAGDMCAGPLPLDEYGRILRVTSDEVEDAKGNGDGRTCADMVLGEDRTSVALRAEREGRGDGRVYTLHYVVTDPSGHTTPGQCTVRVPHDQSGRAAGNSGVRYCVGEGCGGGLDGSSSCRR